MMSIYDYIKVPVHLSIEQIIKNNYTFAPSKYSKFIPNDGIDYRPLSDLVSISNKKIKYCRNRQYNYAEIGDINVHDGSVDSRLCYGFELPAANAKQLSKDNILISTVRTYRGGIGIVTEHNGSNFCCSPAIMVLQNNGIVKTEYLFAVLRTSFFIEQIIGFQNRGLYPRLEKDALDHILIPIPKSEVEETYIAQVMAAYISKVALIKQRYQKIISIFQNELQCKGVSKSFRFNLPSFEELFEIGRMDMGMYSESYKSQMFIIENYFGGYSTIEEMGFKLSRGQNLQVSNIGESIYSKEYHKGFYTLMLPMFLSKYGTCEKVEYLGNSRELKTLKRGDLIFGAEGFDKGRSIVIIEEQEKAITNIHGITIQQTEGHDLGKAIFLKCFLDYMRSKGMIDSLAVGGNGGSLAQRYWRFVIVPNFPHTVKKEIINLYHSNTSYPNDKFTYENFVDEDNVFNEYAGIYELDKSAKLLKRLLDTAIKCIANNEKVQIKYK